MSRSCETCSSENRPEIEHLQSTGVSLSEIARRLPPLTKHSLSRHFGSNHHVERALDTETTTIHAELGTVIRELLDTPDPSRAETVREREATEGKRAVLTARRGQLKRLVCERLQTLRERTAELEERRDLLTYRHSEAELEAVERELAEATAAIHEIERGERGRKLDEAELAQQAAAQRTVEDRHCLEKAREAHTALCHKLEKSWEAFGPLLRAWCQSIESLDLAANRVGEAHSPVNAERFVFVNWLTGKLTSSLDVPTIRMAGIRTPRVGHVRTFLAEPEAKATEPKSQGVDGRGKTTTAAVATTSDATATTSEKEK